MYIYSFQLSVDTHVVEFGTTVIGETLKRTFTLNNNGALGTKYEFFKLTGSKLRTVTTAETSLGRLVSLFISLYLEINCALEIIKMYLPNLVHTACFLNNLLQVRSKLKDRKAE